MLAWEHHLDKALSEAAMALAELEAAAVELAPAALTPLPALQPEAAEARRQSSPRSHLRQAAEAAASASEAAEEPS